MACPTIYFQFLGTDEVPTRTICVDQIALKQHPDSLLSKLADDKWKQDVAGKKVNPIVTKPLESLDNWHPNMAGMIERFYNENELVLPKCVELEEALEIMDFYGLPVKEPESIKLDQTDLMTRLRAKLFLEHSTNYKRSIDAIVRAFETKPQCEKNFLFIHSYHSVSYIQNNNDTVYSFLYGSDLIDPSYEWVQRKHLRVRLVVDLEAMGFRVQWRPSIEDGVRVEVAGPQPYERTEKLFTVSVSVGDPEPVAKRQKRSEESSAGDN